MNHHKSTILIVDDEPFGRMTLEALLNIPPYRLAFAENGAEALRQAAHLTPDLILLDVMMPEMDGFEVCRRLRDDPYLAEVPVIIVTALDDRESRLQGIEAGADDLVTKPFDAVELRARVRSITRLNRYRRLLLERARFERLTELAPDGVVIVNIDGSICLANPAFLRMVGVEDDAQAFETNLHTLIAPEQACSFSGWLHHIVTDASQVVRVETVLVCPDGRSVPVEMNMGYVIWGEHPAVQMIVRDNTERKRAEAALRESEERLRRSRDVLRALFDGLGDGMLLLDSEGTVLAINQAMSTLLGSHADLLVGQNWKELCDRPETVFPGQIALKSLQDGRARHYREHYPGAEGQPRVLDMQTVPLASPTPDPQVDQVIMQVMDITERLQVESLAIQNEHFAAQGRLAATVAHEVNTPLQSIQNCLYLARKASEGQRDNYLTLACEEIGRISSILRQLLELKHPPENEDPTMVDVNQVIERVLLLTEGMLANHGIDVECRYAPDLPPTCGYPDRLTQVILNLVLNAMDAMPDGGKLWVNTASEAGDQCRTEMAHQQGTMTVPFASGWNLPPPRSAQSIRIEIIDTGYGIPGDMQARIFDPFFTMKQDGTGIGLAISRKIIVQHGGRITVHSVPGSGSTFTMVLPVWDECHWERAFPYATS
jgi:PAS domain S-box-containing protein